MRPSPQGSAAVPSAAPGTGAPRPGRPALPLRDEKTTADRVGALPVWIISILGLLVLIAAAGSTAGTTGPGDGHTHDRQKEKGLA